MQTAKNLFICAGLLISALTTSAGERKQIPMNPDLWQTDTGVFEKIQGVDAIALRQGMASPKGVTLGNGTVEFDVQPFATGAGLAFRRRDDNTFEYFYIRPNGKCSQSSDCLQYAPQTHGVLLWDVFPQYQAPAPIRDGEWNHIKIVLSGQRMPTEKIQVLVVDDEAPARQRLRDLLHKEHQICAISEAENGIAAVEIIRHYRPDLVFLDVQMPELDGLGVIEAIGAEQMPLTIFVTAYDQHAIRAFDANALDYLLKPFSGERFRSRYGSR